MTTALERPAIAASWLGLALGVGVAVALVAWQGADGVARQLAATDWKLLLVAAFAVPQLLLATESWRLLFAPGRAPRFGEALMALWVGASINLLLPVVGIGGDVARARLLVLWTRRAEDAVASVVVDKTVQLATVPLLALIGVAALLRDVPHAPVNPVLGGVVLLVGGLLAAVLVQRAGAFGFVARRALRDDAGRDVLVARAGAVDAAIRALWARPLTVLASCALRLLSRLSLVGEVWLAARLLGHPIGVLDAVALKSLGLVTRTVAFPVPAGLGVQEGVFVAIGGLIGLPPDVALATSLATRVREVVCCAPGLLAWEWIEGRALWRRAA